MQLTDILSYLFKFKLSFVQELVLFEKWYQEASHTQCLQGSVENLGLPPRFSTPRASPSVHIKLNSTSFYFPPHNPAFLYLPLIGKEPEEIFEKI